MDRKVVLVTGGMGGIGTAISKRLSADYQMVACYLDQHENPQNSNGEIDIIYGDMSDYTKCEALVSSVVKRYGHIDVLVNNAGITRDSTPLEQWQQIIDAKLTNVFNITRNVLPIMLEQGYGRIISISSINHYAAAKAALYGFSKSLALEVAGKGITVCISSLQALRESDI